MAEEVNTDTLIKDILKRNKDLFVPYFNKQEMVMVRIRDVEDYTSLPVDTYGVRFVILFSSSSILNFWKKRCWNYSFFSSHFRQPRDYKEREDAMTSTGLDLILCPGLGFTKQGRICES